MCTSPGSFDTSSDSSGGGLATDTTMALLMLLILANAVPNEPGAVMGAMGWNQAIVSNMHL